MIKKLIEIDPKNTYLFYLDVSLNETINRHTTKPNKDEFGEKELREWCRERDTLGFDGEIIIDENFSLEDSVKFILDKIKNN